MKFSLFSRRILGTVIVLTFLIAVAEASDGFRVNFGIIDQSVTAHSVCQKVTNNSLTGKDVYIPTISAEEWLSFRTNPPTGITLANCGPATTTVIFLTSGTTWTVPDDWNPSNNSIEVIGGGGGGGGGNPARGYLHTGGGAGGGYSAITNLSLTPGNPVAYKVGDAGAGGGSSANGGVGGDTYFCNGISNCSAITNTSVVVGAKGGGGGLGTDNSSTAAAVGGQASAGVGTIKYSGGNGKGIGGTYSGGGGGAAGPNGNGISATSAAGGAGDAGLGGAGGSANSAGGNGTEWDTTHGSGGGSGGRSSAGAVQNAGLYGAGGGGGAGQNGGAGRQGIIVITYGP